MHSRHFALAILSVLALASPAVAERRASSAAAVAVSSSKGADQIQTVENKKPAFGLSVPRGGKAVVAPAPFISQSASVMMGIILALNSGFINGCALSGVFGKSQAVAAVTASWTNSALNLASGNSDKFIFFAKVIGSYMFGSLIAGYLEPKPSPFLVSSSAFGLPLTVAAGMMVLAKAFLDGSSSWAGFYFLAIANGINNSVTSTMTSNLCRSAHFSGITSDMGTFIGQILRGNKTNEFKLKVFAGLATAFWFGGLISHELSKKHGTSILYLSAAVYLFMAGGFDKVAKKLF